MTIPPHQAALFASPMYSQSLVQGSYVPTHFFWSILFAFTICTAAFADYARSNEPTAVVTEHWPPYNYIDGTELTGAATTIVKDTLARANMPATMQLLPWARAYAQAKNTPNVLIYSIIRTPQREAEFHWIGPMAHDIAVGIHCLAARKDIQVNSVQDALKYKFGAIRGGSMHTLLLAHGFSEGVNLELSVTTESLLQKLFAGRIDLVGGSIDAQGLILREYGYNPEDLRELVPLGAMTPYLACSLGTPDATVQALRKAMQSIPPSAYHEAWAAHSQRTKR